MGPVAGGGLPPPVKSTLCTCMTTLQQFMIHMHSSMYKSDIDKSALILNFYNVFLLVTGLCLP
jgi:hypothetical protein